MKENNKKIYNTPEWHDAEKKDKFAVKLVAAEPIHKRDEKHVTSTKSHEVLIDELVEKILENDRASLARAITLVESNSAQHYKRAKVLLEKILPYTGNSIRIGISGIPGAGKSTLIEALGLYLISLGHKVAVLAVDPSSSITKGSILGDKTRMERLSREPNGFIRPSPAGGNLGGVTRKSRETMLLCEAAGYDVILFDLPEHMAVGVALSKTISGSYVDYNGKRYYYAETTNPGWTIGKAPQEVIGKPVTVIPIPDKPSGTQLQIEKINEYLNYNPELLKQLENENSQLKKENQKLLEQVSQLQKENQKLKSEYQELAEKNQQLASQLEYLQTINEALSKTNEELIEENENLSFQVMQLESEKAQLEWKIDDLEFKIRTLNHTISELKPKAMMMDALIGALPMLLGIGIAVLIGIAVAFYYLGRSAERKEILGI